MRLVSICLLAGLPLLGCSGVQQELTSLGREAATTALEAAVAPEPSAEAPSAEAPSAEAPSAEAPSAGGNLAAPEAPSGEAPSVGAPEVEAPTAEAPEVRGDASAESRETPGWADSTDAPPDEIGDGFASPQGGLGTRGSGDRDGASSGTNSEAVGRPEVPSYLRMVNAAVPTLFGDWTTNDGEQGLSFSPDGHFSRWGSAGPDAAEQGTWELVRRLPSSCVVATSISGGAAVELEVDLANATTITVNAAGEPPVVYGR